MFSVKWLSNSRQQVNTRGVDLLSPVELVQLGIETSEKRDSQHPLRGGGMDAEEKYETLTAPVDSTSSPGVVSTENIGAIIRRHYLEHSRGTLRRTRCVRCCPLMLVTRVSASRW